MDMGNDDLGSPGALLSHAKGVGDCSELAVLDIDHRKRCRASRGCGCRRAGREDDIDRAAGRESDGTDRGFQHQRVPVEEERAFVERHGGPAAQGLGHAVHRVPWAGLHLRRRMVPVDTRSVRGAWRSRVAGSGAHHRGTRQLLTVDVEQGAREQHIWHDERLAERATMTPAPRPGVSVASFMFGSLAKGAVWESLIRIPVSISLGPTAEGANSHLEVHSFFLPKVRIRTFPWALKR